MSDTINNTWIIKRLLGSGAFADVYLCQHNVTGKYAVAKITEYSEEDAVKIKKFVDAEIDALNRLRGHVNIVELYEVIQEKDCTILMLEYVEGVELFDLLQDQECHYLSVDLVKDIATQLLNAIRFMHSQGVLWRDLKLENIMVDRQGVVKCLDFNLATTFVEKQQLKTCCGTPQYTSPLVLFAGVFKTSYEAHSSVDLWSLGVSLYAASTGSFPFGSKGVKRLLDEIKDYCHGKRRLYFPPHLSLELVDFLKTLLQPATTVEVVSNHSWLNDIATPKKPERTISADSLDTLVNYSTQ